MSKAIRIGTRDSELALWQAHTVQAKLEALGYKTEIVAVKSAGDVELDVPLYEFGITGIFTKILDVAMIKNEVDIAVHSMKDVPTSLPKGMVQGAVLERANTNDILVHKGNLDFLNSTGTIATGSLRRQAQWLNRYPEHTVTGLRGNVNTRLRKLNESNWGGAIFAQAGLHRINLLPENHLKLDWMIPAPAQGAMVIAVMEENKYCLEAVAKLNHKETEICTYIERQFLKTLEGGCTAPIGALAQYQNDSIVFEGTLLSIDGKQKIDSKKIIPIDSDYSKFGEECAEEVLNNGGKALMEEIRKALNNKEH